MPLAKQSILDIKISIWSVYQISPNWSDSETNRETGRNTTQSFFAKSLNSLGQSHQMVIVKNQYVTKSTLALL